MFRRFASALALLLSVPTSAHAAVEFLGWAPDNNFYLYRSRSQSDPIWEYSFCLTRKGESPTWPAALGAPAEDQCVRINPDRYQKLPGRLVTRPNLAHVGPRGETVRISMNGAVLRGASSASNRKGRALSIHKPGGGGYILDGILLDPGDWVSAPAWRSDGKGVAILVHRPARGDYADLLIQDLSDLHRPAQKILQDLSSPDSTTAARARDALAQVNDPAAIPGLIAACAAAPPADVNNTGEVCSGAAAALRAMPQSAAPLADLLRHQNPLLRRWAAQTIGSMSAPARTAPLLAALAHADEAVRDTAADALRDRLDPGTEIPALLDLLRQSPTAPVRIAAIRALAAVQTTERPGGQAPGPALLAAAPRIVEAMAAAATDHESEVRRLALDWLGSCAQTQPVVASTLLRALSDPPSRALAVHALRSDHAPRDPRLVEPLIAALSDPALRSDAIESLTRQRDARAVPPLLSLLRGEQDDDKALEIIDRLADLPDGRAVPPLLSRWRAQDRAEREASFAEEDPTAGYPSAARRITLALVAIAAKDTQPFVAAFRGAKSAEVRRFLVDVIGESLARSEAERHSSDAPGGAELVTLAQSDPDAAVRKRAEAASKRLAQAAAPADNTAPGLNRRGMRAYKAHNLRQAEDLFRAAIAADKSFVLARYNLACVASLRQDLPTVLAELSWLKAATDPRAADRFRAAAADKDFEWASRHAAFRALLGQPPLERLADVDRLTEAGRMWTMEDSPCGGPGYDLTFQVGGALTVRRFEGCNDWDHEETFSGKWAQKSSGINLQVRKLDDLHGARVMFGSCEHQCWEQSCEQTAAPTACLGLIVSRGGEASFEGPFVPRMVPVPVKR